MVRYFDVMRKIIELSDSCLEGIQYIKEHIGCSKDIALLVFYDVVSAIDQMERSISICEIDIDTTQIEEYLEILWGIIEEVVSILEYHNYDRAKYVIHNFFLPNYQDFKKELERILQIYIIS